MHRFDLDSLTAGLPAAALLPGIAELTARGPVRAVVEAPPGTGKTTLVPPALAEALAGSASGADSANASGSDSASPGRVVVAQPRRVAARAGAARLAALSGTRLGGPAGYTVRGQRSVSAHTRVEFVTYGVLLRRLLGDPELSGTAAVVLDEIHERRLDSDLAFGMLRELVELREDLGLVVMSATLDAGVWAELLGGGGSSVGSGGHPDDDGHPDGEGRGAGAAPVLSASAPAHPLEVRWAPPEARPLTERGVRPEFWSHVAAQARAAAAEPDSGDVLVFVPAIADVARVARQLRSGITGPPGIEVLELSGATPPADQDRILRGTGSSDAPDSPDAPGAAAGRCARIIVSTAVAESSLTVPGVRTVIDSGLSRQPRLDTVRGMSGLVTVRESKDSGTQRAGRAARVGTGRVVRCMAEAEWAALPARTPPEITTAELTPAVLDLACWGAPLGAGLALPDPVPERAGRMARDALIEIGALDDTGRATAFGRTLARIPADPRHARALLLGAPVVGARTAAEVVAALASDRRAPDGDLTLLLRELRRSGERTWKQESARLADIARQETAQASDAPAVARRTDASRPDSLPEALPAPSSEETVGLLVALARPDRIALLRPGSDAEYLLASGTGARLPRNAPGLAGSTWLAVADVDLVGATGLIRAAAPVSEESALAAGAHLRSTHEEADYADGRIRGRAVDRLGAIELRSTPVRPSAHAVEDALARAVGRLGPEEVLRPPPAFAELRGRLGFLHEVRGAPWPDVRWDALLARFTGRLAEKAPVSWLRELLPWPEASELDALVPTHITVPSGRRVAVSYPDPDAREDPDALETSGRQPVVAVKLQECFGWSEGPRICGVPVLLHLLSPAGRPLAITADLAGFWDGAYAHVRAENRNRYAKHPWPEDPWSAPPARGTKRSGR